MKNGNTDTQWLEVNLEVNNTTIRFCRKFCSTYTAPGGWMVNYKGDIIKYEMWKQLP